jgi:hypothetical protein
MPDFSLPGVVRMETLRRGDLQADCLSCTPYAAECSQPLNSAKNLSKALKWTPQKPIMETGSSALNQPQCPR